MKLILAAMLPLLNGATVKTQEKLSVLVDGKPVKFVAGQPRTMKGRVMVPLRGVFEAIGAYVEYDEENRMITAKKNSETVELKMGEKVARKNGAEIMLDSPPDVVGGTTMVPLRFIAEALGGKVEFDKPNNQVLITTG
ncbi:MAG: stalk domain-containing protein [Fimbriimonas sp.]